MSSFTVLTIEQLLPDILQDSVKALKDRSNAGIVKRNGVWYFCRYLFVKPHGGVEKNTLFVANIPITWSEEETSTFFSTYGRLDSVNVGCTNNCKFARISFEKSKSIKRILEIGKLNEHIEYEGTPEHHNWLSEYEKSFPDVNELKKDTEEFLQALEISEQEAEEQRIQREKEVDEDGFTVVRHKNSSRLQQQTGTTVPHATIGAKFIATKTGSTKKIQAGKAKGELQNFYRYQMREQKREQLAGLRKKFEEDKLQIERLKASRKFRPF